MSLSTLSSLRLRHTFRLANSRSRIVQRRWAQVHDIRFVTTHQDPEKVLEKYQDKLVKKAKEQVSLLAKTLKIVSDRAGE